MAIVKFTYPLKGNNDPASLRTKETALEGFLNQLDLSDDPDDPNHAHDSQYSPIDHAHPGADHDHDDVYTRYYEQDVPPSDPDTGDVWAKNITGLIEQINVYTSEGWVDVMGGGGGGSGPHSRHPDRIVVYQASSDLDKWRVEFNPTLESLDFTYVG